MNRICKLGLFLAGLLSLPSFAAEPTVKAKLKIISPTRVITQVNGKYRVDINFDRDQHSNDRTVNTYFAISKNAQGQDIGVFTKRFSEICPPSVTGCTFPGVFLGNTLAEAEAVNIRIGQYATAMVRFIDGVNTEIPGTSEVCEYESCNQVTTHVGDCSCGPNLTSRSGSLSSALEAIYSYQNEEHYHTGYFTTVE